MAQHGNRKTRVNVPKRISVRQKRFNAMLAKINREYGPALKKLSE